MWGKRELHFPVLCWIWCSIDEQHWMHKCWYTLLRALLLEISTNENEWTKQLRLEHVVWLMFLCTYFFSFSDATAGRRWWLRRQRDRQDPYMNQIKTCSLALRSIPYLVVSSRHVIEKAGPDLDPWGHGKRRGRHLTQVQFSSHSVPLPRRPVSYWVRLEEIFVPPFETSHEISNMALSGFTCNPFGNRAL